MTNFEQLKILTTSINPQRGKSKAKVVGEFHRSSLLWYLLESNHTASKTTARTAGLLAIWSVSSSQIVSLFMDNNTTTKDAIFPGKRENVVSDVQHDFSAFCSNREMMFIIAD